MTAMPDIKPCPYCGHDASVEESPNGLDGVMFSVGCDNTEEMCHGYQALTQWSTKREAIEAWNKRAPIVITEDHLRFGLERLKEAPGVKLPPTSLLMDAIRDIILYKPGQ